MDGYTFFFMLIGVCTVTGAVMKMLSKLEGER